MVIKLYSMPVTARKYKAVVIFDCDASLASRQTIHDETTDEVNLRVPFISLRGSKSCHRRSIIYGLVT